MIAADTPFLASLLGAVLMGMSCGTGCSPAISVFLSSYIFHAEGDSRVFAASFAKFFFGKTLAVLAVCSAAAAAGTSLLGESGYFGRYTLKYLMPAFLILMGIYLLHKCWSESQNKGCSHCAGHCHSGHIGGSSNKADSRQQIIGEHAITGGHAISGRHAVTGGRKVFGGHRNLRKSLTDASPLFGGFFYGLTPCAPLILLAGYAVTLPLARALILGTVFSLSCMVSPLLFMLILMKLVVVKMKQESPGFLRLSKVMISAMVLIIGIVTCFTGLEPHG